MHVYRNVVRAGCLAAAATGLAHGQAFTETFENGVNTGGWTFGSPMEGIDAAGGAPGAFLHATGLDTTIPFLRTTATGSPFTGDYRAREVSSVSVSLNVFHTDFNIGARPPAVILYSDNGTPGDPDDDWGAYQLSTNALAPAGQWANFAWIVPSASASLPPDWNFIEFGPSAPNPSWDALVRNVSALEFSFGDPSLFYIFQMWEVGADSVLIVQSGGSCYANCDGSSQAPLLNVNDFICFQGKFAAGDLYANCDGSTEEPVLNVNDFVCFQAKFAAGCSAP
jgi:hypothetical protein